VFFEILDDIEHIETIAVGSTIRELERLKKHHGKGRWRKRKGIALIRLADGSLARAELHWYEVAGIGRKEYKIKRVIGEN
jgi:hypothetical protein